MYASLFQAGLVVVGVVAVVAFVVAAFQSPAATLSDDEFNRQVKVGQDPRAPHWGGRWTTVGVEAQRNWWARVFAHGAVLAVFALLCYLGMTHKG